MSGAVMVDLRALSYAASQLGQRKYSAIWDAGLAYVVGTRGDSQ
jgi:hypothetical protein